MSRKTFLCRCEDITLDDCTEAMEDGYTCFEDLKRFLGVGTGPCQGKACVQAAMHLIAERQGVPLDEVDVMTFRPPLRPIRFSVLAAQDATPDTPTDTTKAGRSTGPGTGAGSP